jgi:membrane protein DedA with SNARE-associated domain
LHVISPDQLAHLLQTYGYGLVLVVVALESAGIPLPGETVLISAAAYAGAHHEISIAGVVAAAAAGAILGDNIGFWVGREVGPPILSKFGALVGLDERRQRLGQYLFRRHGGKIVFFGRFVAFLRAFAAILAGVNRLPPLRFFAFNAAGGIIWASLFGFGGYFLGHAFHRIAGPFGWAMFAAALVAVVLGWRFYKQNEERLLEQAESAMNAEAATSA